MSTLIGLAGLTLLAAPAQAATYYVVTASAERVELIEAAAVKPAGDKLWTIAVNRIELHGASVLGYQIDCTALRTKALGRTKYYYERSGLREGSSEVRDSAWRTARQSREAGRYLDFICGWPASVKAHRAVEAKGLEEAVGSISAVLIEENDARRQADQSLQDVTNQPMPSMEDRMGNMGGM